jgi:hypothetical protein
MNDLEEPKNCSFHVLPRLSAIECVSLSYILVCLSDCLVSRDYWTKDRCEQLPLFSVCELIFVKFSSCFTLDLTILAKFEK